MTSHPIPENGHGAACAGVDAALEALAQVDEAGLVSPTCVHSDASHQVSAPTRVDDSGAGKACPQHPTAPVIGGVCGGCTQYPADMTRKG
ncbi:hypothetical protein [Streptomyces scabiei]|uniref:hypothetical protein n=1 Tax=Streptomyces scabiei TaxID=1930 RepID=UPI001B310AC0|nr:hypothetical protein [Streptomyces sp. LBUM 1475]QTU64245.1 hypothetical protein F3K22_27420 [Streptomyces sp. LBUM 1475]